MVVKVVFVFGPWRVSSEDGGMEVVVLTWTEMVVARRVSPVTEGLGCRKMKDGCREGCMRGGKCLVVHVIAAARSVS